MQVLMCEVNNDNSQAKDVLLLSERLENEPTCAVSHRSSAYLTLNADLVRSSHVLSTADRLMRSPRQSPVRVAGWGRTRRTRCFGVEHRSLKTRDKAIILTPPRSTPERTCPPGSRRYNYSIHSTA